MALRGCWGLVLLFLDSTLVSAASVVGVGVAGWNIESGSWLFLVFGLGGFGTLLGPEGTPCWGVSSGPWPGSPNALLVGVVVVGCGLGCGCALSVA